MAPAAAQTTAKTTARASRASATPVKSSPKMTRSRASIKKDSEANSAAVAKQTPIKTPAKKSGVQKAKNGPVNSFEKLATPNSASKSNGHHQKTTPLANNNKKSKETIKALDQIVSDIENSNSNGKKAPQKKLPEKFVDNEAESGESDVSVADSVSSQSDASDEQQDNALPVKNSILKASQHQTETANKNGKRVSFVASEKSEKQTAMKKTADVDPTTLNEELALVIKGLSFKCTAQDIKKRLPQAQHVRLPMSVRKQNQNNGYCIVYFKDQVQCDAAYKSLREQPKILARDCFVSYLKVRQNKHNADTREKDTTTLYISNFPRTRNATANQVLNIFPDAKYIFLKQIHNRCIMFVKFNNSVAAGVYLKKAVHFEGKKLSVQFANKESNTAAVQDTKSAAELSKKQPQAKKSKVEEKKPVEEVQQSESDEDISEEDSSDDADNSSSDVDVDQDGGDSTDSEDESSE